VQVNLVPREGAVGRLRPVVPDELGQQEHRITSRQTRLGLVCTDEPEIDPTTTSPGGVGLLAEAEADDRDPGRRVPTLHAQSCPNLRRGQTLVR
jgi:hypothetical protein